MPGIKGKAAALAAGFVLVPGWLPIPAEPETVSVPVEQILFGESGVVTRSSQTVDAVTGTLADETKSETETVSPPPVKVSPRLSAALAASHDNRSMRVLVTFPEDQELPQFPDSNPGQPRESPANAAVTATAAKLVDQITSRREPGYARIRQAVDDAGGRVLQTFWLFKGILAELPSAAVETFAARDDVRYVESTVGDAPPRLPAVPYLDSTRVLMATDPYFNAGFIGDRVGLLDSGVRSTHRALSSPTHLASVHDLTAEHDPSDHCNHGTSSAAVITGNDYSDTDASERGVTASPLDSFKVYTGTSNVIDGCQLDVNAAANAFQEAVKLSDKIIVANMQADASDVSTLDMAADNAEVTGAVVIAANGNFGPQSGSVRAPANARKVLGVGAVVADRPDLGYPIAAYSGRGPSSTGRTKPEIVAPSHMWAAAGWNDTTDQYFDGTSAAAPHAGGAASLLRNFLRGGGNTLPAGFVNAGMILSGNRPGPWPSNTEGAGKLKLPNNGLYVQASADIADKQVLDIPFTFTGADGCRLAGALWWADSYLEHNDIDLELVDPDGVTQAKSESINGVFELARTAGTPVSGKWWLRVKGYRVHKKIPGLRQRVFVAAHSCR